MSDQRFGVEWLEGDGWLRGWYLVDTLRGWATMRPAVRPDYLLDVAAIGNCGDVKAVDKSIGEWRLWV